MRRISIDRKHFITILTKVFLEPEISIYQDVSVIKNVRSVQNLGKETFNRYTVTNEHTWILRNIPKLFQNSEL